MVTILTDIAERYYLGESTVGNMSRIVCRPVWNVMKEKCIPNVTKENCSQLADGFEKRTQFPHYIEAIDGKYVRLIKPDHLGSLLYNYKIVFFY